ncbi:MAG: hypothetical protein Q4P71_03490 [Actinomycetaceae bacterium]|nr:hypothetical protein [Actinomycetaceae bacterium]
MSNQHGAVSRRNLLKGLAIGAPAAIILPSVAYGAQNAEVADDLGFRRPIGENLLWTRMIGTREGLGSGTRGSFFDLRLGFWRFNDPVIANCETSVSWNYRDEIRIASIDRIAWNNGRVLSRGPVDAAGNNEWTAWFAQNPANQVFTAKVGYGFVGSIQSTMPYSIRRAYCKVGKNEAYRNLLVSVPFGISFYDKGSAVLSSKPEGADAYHWNVVLRSGPYGVTYLGDALETFVTKGLPTLDGSTSVAIPRP